MFDQRTVSFVTFSLDDDRVKAALGPNGARDLRFARRSPREPADIGGAVARAASVPSRPGAGDRWEGAGGRGPTQCEPT